MDLVYLSVEYFVFHAHAHGLGHAGKMPITVHRGFRIGQTNTAITMVIVDRVARIVCQLLVTCAAECQVVPDVSSLRSTSTTSVHPS